MNKVLIILFPYIYSLLMMLIVNYLQKLPKNACLALVLSLVLIISLIDNLIIIDLGLSIFYLIPITFATWFLGIQYGIIVSLVSCLSRAIAEYTTNSSKYINTFAFYWDLIGLLCFFILVSYLFYSLKKAYKHEQKLARTDELTQAHNRRFFMQALKNEINRSQRNNHPLTIAYIDVDNFKQVNDEFGHGEGDRLLKQITEQINHCLRPYDMVARLGGDEFAILLPETDYQQSASVLYRIHETLVNMSAQQFSFIGFSMGAITYDNPLAIVSVEQIISQADNLMYSVKISGKNRIEHQIYTPNE